jgi:hypothetical protein
MLSLIETKGRVLSGCRCTVAVVLLVMFAAGVSYDSAPSS